ncbi:hypothetical protein CASFOL_042422 [Castilleja foliolosa]|uniref:Uncharacterized protein n=1 Tax=Castilleja foliolosa TaxID=1961234 RepID=A0ABD3BAD4_9LAMI
MAKAMASFLALIICFMSLVSVHWGVTSAILRYIMFIVIQATNTRAITAAQ